MAAAVGLSEHDPVTSPAGQSAAVERQSWLTMSSLLLIIALGAPAASAPPPATSMLGHGSQPSRAAYVVGTQLEAKQDTTLRGAKIVKGSRVTIVGVGDAALDLELADGHVVRGVSLQKVAQSFRPAR
jgi:hypothetical protein